MRSIDDLTARARIRDAALDVFARNGFNGTSVRDVARAAGVSPSLVQHHFGTKAGLREACDEYAVGVVRTIIARKVEERAYNADFIASLLEAGRGVHRYITRGLTEGWPGMAAIFDQMAGDTARWLSGVWPERFPEGSDAARLHGGVLAAMSLGHLLLHSHLKRWAGVDPLDPGQQHLTSGAAAELMVLVGQYLETEHGLSMRAAMEDYNRRLSARPQHGPEP